jgi:hypothetical protein
MTASANEPAGSDDDALRAEVDAELSRHAAELAAAVEGVLPGWVVRSVDALHRSWQGPPPPVVVAQAEEAGRRAAAEVGAELRRLLAADVDAQWTNPLSLLRGAVRYPAEVLRDAGVPPVVREAFDKRHFPDDDYDLTPRAFADVDPSLHEVGLVWGAMKARAHLARRAAGGG